MRDVATVPCDNCQRLECDGAPRFKGVCAAQAYVSSHDRGAFGALLAEAKVQALKKGLRTKLTFHCWLDSVDEEQRWQARLAGNEARTWDLRASGRTGEEALRRLVEKLRG